MKASTFYRAAAVLLLLFATGHTFSFSLVDPKWGLDNILAQMRTIHFRIGNIERTYWDFYLGNGLTVGVLYFFSAVLAWQLGSLRPETLKELRLATWAFALAFAGVAAVSMIHLFMVPIAFSLVITICLAAAAWQASK